MIASTTAQAAGQKLACRQSCSSIVVSRTASAARAGSRAQAVVSSKVRQTVGGLPHSSGLQRLPMIA
jgi:hypothetical protein